MANWPKIGAQMTHGGYRHGAGRKVMPVRKKRVPLALTVAYKTRQNIIDKYGYKNFAEWLDEEFGK